MEWTTACPDWESRILARQSLVPCRPLFEAPASDGVKFFSLLRVVDVPGRPTMGEICRPWALDFVGSIFGAYDPKSHRRLITEFFLLVSKKNTKSTMRDDLVKVVALREDLAFLLGDGHAWNAFAKTPRIKFREGLT